MLHIEGTKEQGNEKVEKGKKNKQKLKWRSKTSHGAGPDFKGDNARFAGAAVSEELSFIRCVAPSNPGVQPLRRLESLLFAEYYRFVSELCSGWRITIPLD